MKTTESSTFHAAGHSDVGLVRQGNEDRYLLLPERGLFIVADGMGGMQAGEVASQAVIDILPRMLETILVSTGNNPSQEAIESTLRESIVTLSTRLHQAGLENPEQRGMGSTLALAWLRGSQVYIVNMGDSRIYLLRDGSMRQVTEDHTIVTALVRAGYITPQEALTHPAQHLLSRYIGMEGEVFPDIQLLKLDAGDRLLLCSDGLSGMVSDEEISKILRANPAPQAAVRSLVGAAKVGGGKDNITAVVIDYHGIPTG